MFSTQSNDTFGISKSRFQQSTHYFKHMSTLSLPCELVVVCLGSFLCIGSLQYNNKLLLLPLGFYSTSVFPMQFFCSGLLPDTIYVPEGTMGNKGGFSAVHCLSPFSQGGKLLIIGLERPCVG